MPPCLPRSIARFASSWRGSAVPWAALAMLLLLWQGVGSAMTPGPAAYRCAGLHPAPPVPHEGLPLEQALATSEAEPEAGRGKPPGAKHATCEGVERCASLPGQVPHRALAIRIEVPRRPPGQAPPRCG